MGRKVPVIPVAIAAEYEASVQPLSQFTGDIGDMTYSAFPTAAEGDFAIRIDGTSMLPTYPPGTLLLVRPSDFPQPGDLVLAKLHTGAVVCRRYTRSADTIALEPPTPGDSSETITWHVKQTPGFILWMWPVLASLRDERRNHHPAANMGLDQ